MRNVTYIVNRYLILSVGVVCFLGAGVLSFLGYEMGSDAPTNFTKIHPVAYLLIGSSLVNISRIKNKAAIFWGYGNNKYEFRILALIVAIFAYLYVTSNLSSVSFIVDTLLCPVLVALNFSYYPEPLKWNTRKWCVQLILLNSYIAIGERLFAVNLFPITAHFGDIFRSTALLGHPLNNALITLVVFIYVAAVAIPVRRKIYIMTVLFTALICFGARGALYVSVLALLLLFIVPVFVSRSAYFKKINKANITLLIAGMLGMLVYVTLNTTLGERLVDASFYDSSAEVRTQALDVIDIHEIGNYLGAKSQDDIDTMSYYAEVEIIENFFIIWILKFGLLITGLLLLLLYQLFYARIPVPGSMRKHIMVLLLFVAAATNNSLATNTQTLSIFVILFSLTRLNPGKHILHHI